MKEIGAKYGVGVAAVSERMIKLGIPRRRSDHGEADISESELHDLYESRGLSRARIARIYGCSINRVHTLMVRCGIKARDEQERAPRGQNHPNWNGGIGWVGVNGYRCITDPFTGGHLYEHRAIMEKHLGRKLRRDEHVHHKNGNKLDNRLENLEVMNALDHFRVTQNNQIKAYRELKKENKQLRRHVHELAARLHRALNRIAVLEAK